MNNNILTRLALAIVALLAASTAQAQVVEYYHLDGLGSVRVVTKQDRTVLERHDYLPFGEECTTGGCASNPGVGAGTPRKFTGKERDAETGLDYFGARYYGSKVGRFTTVDPVHTWGENLVDPQRWNRYAYVRNNPLRHTDPDGRAITPETIWDVASLSMSIQAARDDPGNVWNWIAVGADALAVAAPIAPAVGMAIRGAGKADDVARAMKRGRESEARVLEALGEAKNTQRVRGCEGCSIPDYMNPTTIGDIKDAARVDNTRQLRIQREAAQASGREHVVQTGTGTKVGGKVEKSGSVVKRRDDLGPKTQ